MNPLQTAAFRRKIYYFAVILGAVHCQHALARDYFRSFERPEPGQPRRAAERGLAGE